MKLCFFGFDSVSQKLIISLFKASKVRPVIMEDCVSSEADICLFNYESESDQSAYNQVRETLIRENKHLVLFTSDGLIQNNEYITVVLKPNERGGITDYLLSLKTIIHSVIAQVSDKKNIRQESKKTVLAKTIMDKHLSNAINPSQIQFDRNRFHAQKHVGSHADIDMDDKSQLKTIQFNPKNYLYYQLKEARKESQIKNQITGINTVYGLFYVDAKDGLIYTNKSDVELKKIHNIAMFSKTKIISKQINGTDSERLNSFDYEPFVWQSAIKASKGRILNGLDHNQPVMLNGWPNLPKLLVFKYAIQIISLWSRGDYSLKQTPQILKIPQRYITTTFAALDALGLISSKN